MCLVKTIVSLLVMLMAGLQSVQSQNWVIVKERSVGVDSESLRVGGVLGKAKKVWYYANGTVWKQGMYGLLIEKYKVSASLCI